MIRDYKTPRWGAGGARRREKFPRLARLLTILGVLLLIGGATAAMWEGYRAVLRLSYFRWPRLRSRGGGAGYSGSADGALRRLRALSRRR